MKPENYPSEPAHLWQHFYQITQTPRPSGEEAALREHIIELAEQQGCSWQTDAGGNLVVYVPGSAGREACPPVVIQNHLDMVTVKTDDKQHDFSADPLQLQVGDGWCNNCCWYFPTVPRAIHLSILQIWSISVSIWRC